MIECVEGIDANLELRFFGELEIFPEREVRVPKARAANHAAPEIAGPDGKARYGTDGNSGERRGIEIEKRLVVVGIDGIPGDVIGTADIFTGLFTDNDRLAGRPRKYS